MTNKTQIQTTKDQQLTTLGEQDPITAKVQKEKGKNSLAKTMGKSLSLKGQEVSNLVSGGSKKYKNKHIQKKEDPYLITVPLDKFEAKLAKKRGHIS